MLWKCGGNMPKCCGNKRNMLRKYDPYINWKMPWKWLGPFGACQVCQVSEAGNTAGALLHGMVLLAFLKHHLGLMFWMELAQA
jgi:hypothetical protein